MNFDHTPSKFLLFDHLVFTWRPSGHTKGAKPSGTRAGLQEKEEEARAFSPREGAMLSTFWEGQGTEGAPSQSCTLLSQVLLGPSLHPSFAFDLHGAQRAGKFP